MNEAASPRARAPVDGRVLIATLRQAPHASTILFHPDMLMEIV